MSCQSIHDIIHVFSHNSAKVKIDSHDFLPLEKMLTLHVIVCIKSVFNNDQNYYYYNMFLGKISDQLFEK